MIQNKTEQKWLDHKGQKVPREYINGFDVRKEATIGKLMKQAKQLQEKISAFKSVAFADCDRIYAEMLRQADIDPAERKGNFSMYSFDKSAKVEINVSERIEFDENINFAQIKINEFLESKINNADPAIIELVNNAFKTTKGRLDTKRIFQLFTLKITDPLWLQAMELIKKSMSTNDSVRYLTLWEEDGNGKYSQVQLNFSAL